MQSVTILTSEHCFSIHPSFICKDLKPSVTLLTQPVMILLFACKCPLIRVKKSTLSLLNIDVRNVQTVFEEQLN